MGKVILVVFTKMIKNILIGVEFEELATKLNRDDLFIGQCWGNPTSPDFVLELT